MKPCLCPPVISRGLGPAFWGCRASFPLLWSVPSIWKKTRDSMGPQGDGSDGAVCQLGSKKAQRLRRTPSGAAPLSFSQSTPPFSVSHPGLQHKLCSLRLCQEFMGPWRCGCFSSTSFHKVFLERKLLSPWPLGQFPL